MTWDGLTPNSFWYDQHRLLYNADCRSMADLPDEFVQMVVTSPPYWGLRKYAGLPDLIWGGDPNCGHTETTLDETRHDNLRFRGEHSIVGNEKNREIHPVHSWAEPTFAIQGNNSMVRGKDETDSGNFAIPKFKGTDMKQRKEVVGNTCSLCGAWKGAYGLEPTPEMYVQHTIEILREIRRVLRKDGVVFWNIGDSYATSSPGTSQMEPVTWEENGQEKKRGMTRIGKVKGLKPKDLCLIPFRLAIRLQEDGWWVRSVIIWNKPNPMPESVTDRPTESHEYILLLTKSAKYYWDAEAVRETYTEPMNRWGGQVLKSPPNGFDLRDGDPYKSMARDRDMRPNPSGRNLRSVWTFPTQPYPEAHFATYPEKLVEICVKAATPEVGCCSKCGKPWVRITEQNKTDTRPGKNVGLGKSGQDSDPNQALHQSDLSKYRQQIGYQTLGWQPQCKCNAEKIPSIVLDPFAGSGTTLKVAAELNRRAIGYELSEQYCKLAVERNRQAVLVW